MALRYLEQGRIKMIIYRTDVSKDLIFTRTHIITFWLPIRHLAFRTEAKPLPLKQRHVLTGPSLLDMGPSIKPSLSLVSYESEVEKETLARRYRSVSRDLPSS